MSDHVIVVVLAGGASSRMGVNKAHLTVAGTTMIQRVLQASAGANLPAVVVGGRSDVAPDDVPHIDDDNPGKGPVQALATAMRMFDYSWYVPIACDMPFVRPSHLQWVTSHLGNIHVSEDDIEVVAPFAHGRIQPMLAAYSSRLRNGVLFSVDVAIQSFAELLESSKVHVISADSCPDFESSPFTNVNTPEDYQQVLASLC